MDVLPDSARTGTGGDILYRKPIGPAAHGAIDYAFATLNTLAPTLFGLKGPAKPSATASRPFRGS
jgi:hypothetical protein